MVMIFIAVSKLVLLIAPSVPPWSLCASKHFKPWSVSTQTYDIVSDPVRLAAVFPPGLPNDLSYISCLPG